MDLLFEILSILDINNALGEVHFQFIIIDIIYSHRNLLIIIHNSLLIITIFTRLKNITIFYKIAEFIIKFLLV
jgi:hypothetical protein